MTVTVEIMKPGTFNLLRDLENLGLIHLKPSVLLDSSKTAENEKGSFAERFLGIHAGHNKGSVEEFLAECRADKEREYEIERRQDEERARLAKAKLSS